MCGGEFTEKAFDQGFHFMIFEIEGDQMHFQVITDQGKTVDSGIITRRTSRGQGGTIAAGGAFGETGSAEGQALDDHGETDSTARPSRRIRPRPSRRPAK